MAGRGGEGGGEGLREGEGNLRGRVKWGVMS